MGIGVTVAGVLEGEGHKRKEGWTERKVESVAGMMEGEGRKERLGERKMW